MNTTTLERKKSATDKSRESMHTAEEEQRRRRQNKLPRHESHACHQHHPASRNLSTMKKPSAFSLPLQNNASCLLDLFHPPHTPARPRTGRSLVRILFCLHRCVDSQLEHAIHALHLFAAALDVGRTHSVCNCLALGGGYGSQALGFEEVDAGALVAEVGLQANEDQGGRWAEVEDFRVPLGERVSFSLWKDGGVWTLSMTFSSELGQSMAKQTNNRSVSGYESGRSRSYSSWPAVSHRANSTDLPVAP